MFSLHTYLNRIRCSVFSPPNDLPNGICRMLSSSYPKTHRDMIYTFWTKYTVGPTGRSRSHSIKHMKNTSEQRMILRKHGASYCIALPFHPVHSMDIGQGLKTGSTTFLIDTAQRSLFFGIYCMWPFRPNHFPVTSTSLSIWTKIGGCATIEKNCNVFFETKFVIILTSDIELTKSNNSSMYNRTYVQCT